MPVDIPEQETVDRFLPPYRPHTILSADTPKNINPVIFPWRRQNAEGVLCDGYMEMRHKLHLAFTEVRSVIPAVNADFAAAFGRNHGGFLWTYRAEDADLLLVAMGSIATEATVAVDRLREMGLAAGVVGVRVYRPFPRDEIRQALRGARAAIVFEKDISYGYEGALCTDVRAALYGSDVAIPLQGVVAGLGGRDVKAGEIADYAQQTWDALRSGAEATPVHWLNCATD
jgi:pyruvate/2-oxoacid:ferredoxin oxidoreductase alpha subunit